MNALSSEDLSALMDAARQHQPIFQPPRHLNYESIMYQSGWPWLELDLGLPSDVIPKMHAEATRLLPEFVPHRKYDEQAGYGHSGWKSLCVHGLSATQTENYSSYGHTSHQTAPYRFTEIADRCPETVRFLKELFPFEKYYRVRYMLLEPGGYIAPHRDQKEPGFFGVNIALNQPDECRFGMPDRGVPPFKVGSAILPDLSNLHFVWNQSQTPRIHLILQGEAGSQHERYAELIIRSARLQMAKQQ